MEQTTNFENQNLDQNITPITPQKNIFKILFFILLALVLVITSVLTTLLITKNKTITPFEELTTISSPTETVKEESNIFKISDIQMDLPTGWKVSYVSGNTAKILTDNQISILLEIYKTTHNPSYQASTKTPYGEVWFSPCSLYLCYGASIDTTKYDFNFSVENVPLNLTVEFLEKYNISLETIFNIVKTARPLTEISTATQDWKTYTNSTYGFSFKYPSEYILDEYTTAGKWSLAVWKNAVDKKNNENLIEGTTAYFTCSVNTGEKSFKDWFLKDFGQDYWNQVKTETIGSNLVYYYHDLGDYDGVYEYILTKNNNLIFFTSIGNILSSESTFRQILSSFK